MKWIKGTKCLGFFDPLQQLVKLKLQLQLHELQLHEDVENWQCISIPTSTQLQLH